MGKFSLQSQLLQRNLNWFNAGHWLFVNPADNQIFSSIECDKITAFYQFYDQFLDAPDNIEKHFSATVQTDHHFDGAVIYIPKSKQHLRMLLSDIAPLIKEGCPIMLVGENKGGIKSANKLLQDVTDHDYKVDSAKHCTLLSGQRKADIKPFALTDWISQFEVQIDSTKLTVNTLPGVFSQDGLDPATELLLNQIPHFSKQKWLDFACGCGVIGCLLAKRGNQISLSDTSALALLSTQMTAEANELKVSIIPSNGLAQVQDKFDGVITNPPFHTGIQTDYSVTENFIAQVSKHLSNRGRLYLVANSFLKYVPLLSQSFKHCDTLVKNAKFAVYMAKNEAR
jgi:16S rRNA (guanine1207-N2)-methyltransferase